MYYAAIAAILVLATLMFALLRAIIGQCKISPVDWVNFMFSIPFTFLLVYYKLI